MVASFYPRTNQTITTPTAAASKPDVRTTVGGWESNCAII
jgi:hypothetical protein